MLPRGEDHAADLGIERQFRQLVADAREFLARFVDRPQLRQQRIAVGDHARRRAFEERERLDVPQMQRLHAQDDAGQRGAQDFRIGVGRALGEILLRIKPEADARCHAAATAGALLRRRLRNGLDLQLLDLVAMAVALHSRQAAVDDIADARHGQ